MHRVFAFLLFALLSLSCDRRDNVPSVTHDSLTPIRSLYRSASAVVEPVRLLLNDAPVIASFATEPGLTRDNILVTGAVVGESLRVAVAWAHPADGLGVEDSTFFTIRASKAMRMLGGGIVAANTARRRRHLATITADTFRLVKPAVGDSVIFHADSIRQCRQNACSVPGSAAWGYHRTAAPPAMTFIRVSVDSF